MEDRALPGHDIVVIGGSAGAGEALLDLVKQLPRGFPAAIFVAYHLPPGGESYMHRVLAAARTLDVKLADDSEPIRHGVVYVARADRHLLVDRDAVRVTRGPRENRWRPAIDPLFRSAAVAHGSRVIGIVLTGMLDDGTAGLSAIKRCGGIAIVQDPHDAVHPEMPQSAIDNVPVDHRLALKDMGDVLKRLVREPAAASPPVPDHLRAEARISAQGAATLLSDSPRYICPECGGPLHRHDAPGEMLERYRCMVGHAWNAESLLSGINDQLESTVWASIRLFRQRAQLLTSRARREREAGRERAAHHFDELARESSEHAGRLQHLVMGPLDLGPAAGETPHSPEGRSRTPRLTRA
jgi:two-component system, chemotaxis family, protein-glutamate methylesterase/glutaminase